MGLESLGYTAEQLSLLSDEELVRLSELIEAKDEDERLERATDNFLDFSKYIEPEFNYDGFYNIYYTVLDLFAQGKINRLIVSVPPQHGKQLSHDTPILTTKGWTNHGDLLVGDYVFGRNGNPVKVEALFEECKTEYEVTFSDGAIIHCHGNHEWVIFERHGTIEKKVNTYYLASKNLNNLEKKRGNRNNIQVDCNVSVDFKEKHLELHPYVLGCWLGDGTKRTNVITHHPNDTSHIDKIISLGYNNNIRNTDKNNINVSRFENLSKDLKIYLKKAS